MNPTHALQTRVYPSRLKGTASVPPSKSYTQRALLASLLACGKSELLHPGESEDESHMLKTIQQLGATLSHTPKGWIIHGGLKTSPGDRKIHMGESGLGMRLITPVAAMLEGPTTLTGSGSLLKRPMKPFEEALSEAGGICHTQNGYLPLMVKGPLKGGTVHLDGTHGSQFLSGLLFALPLAEDDSRIIVENLRSKPYIDMTLEVLRHFGIQIYHHQYHIFEIPGKQTYSPAQLYIEGDWSNAAFLMTGAAINGKISITGLNAHSSQGDKKIMEALTACGVSWSHNQEKYAIESPGKLLPFEFNATDCPDLFPPLAILAAYAQGDSVIHGVHRLQHKESNRAKALTDVLSANGLHISQGKHDELIIKGGQPEGGTFDSYKDHRIAMALAILALKAQKPVTIHRADAIGKSFPGFFHTLQKLHATIDLSL